MEGTKLLNSPTIMEGLTISDLGAMIPPGTVEAMRHKISLEREAITAGQGHQSVKIADLTKEFERENKQFHYNITAWILSTVSVLIVVCSGCYCFARFRRNQNLKFTRVIGLTPTAPAPATSNNSNTAATTTTTAAASSTAHTTNSLPYLVPRSLPSHHPAPTDLTAPADTAAFLNQDRFHPYCDPSNEMAMMGVSDEINEHVRTAATRRNIV